jgi:hypothetical protein
VRDLFAELSAGGIAQGATKSLLMSVFTSLFEVATKAVHAVHYGFLVLEIAALKVAIAIAPIALAIQKVMTSAEMLRGLKIILGIIIAPLIVIGTILGSLVVGVLLVAAAFGSALGAIAGAVTWVVGAIGGLVGSAIDALSSLPTAAYDAGGNFITGLANGIAAGTGIVVDAVMSLASATLSAFKSVLGIHSPSAVMMAQGNYVAQGAAIGIDDGSAQVQRAASKMGADVPASLAAGASAPGASRGGARAAGAGATVTFAPGSIVIHGAGKSAMEITEEMFALVFERLAASQGLMSGAT